MTPRRVALLFVLCAGFAAATQTLDMEPDVRAVLTQQLKFSASELADVRRGQIVKHGLPSRAPGEIAVVGALAKVEVEMMVVA